MPDTLLFLDANVLASPVTRTLVIAGARADGLGVVWSRHVEDEADRHIPARAAPLQRVRLDILGMELSPTAPSTAGLMTRSVEDRQVFADAIESGASYLITADVDDFAETDLLEHQMSAVNPDYFMALRYSVRAYREAVAVLVEVAKRPPRTAADVHAMLGRRHPHLTARFADVYASTPVEADLDQPGLLFRGVACVRCGRKLESAEALRTGVGRECLERAVLPHRRTRGGSR